MALKPRLALLQGDLGGVAAAGVTRLIALPISAIFVFATTRLLVDRLGPELYGVATLIVALSALLPFADLGLGAAVVNAVAHSDSPRDDDYVNRVLLTSLRGLAASSVVIIIAAVAIGAIGAWTFALGVPGETPHLNTAVVGSLVLFALGLPFSLGQRVLLGAGRTSSMVVLQSLSAPLAFVLTWSIVEAGGDFRYLVWAAPAAGFTVAVLAALVSSRFTGVGVARLLKRIPRWNRYPGSSVRRTAAPMFVIALGLPIALQTDRLVLSHRSSLLNLAGYALAFQLFAPLWTVLATAGTAMWPMFAGRRKRGEHPQLAHAVGFLLVMAGLGAVVLLVAGPFGAHLLGGGKIAVSRSLLACFALLLAVQAIQLPMGMFLTTERGLRFQAVCVCMMVPVSVGLGWWLAVPLGAKGPVLASVAAVAVCQILPGVYWIRRGNAREPRDRDTSPGLAPSFSSLL